MISLVFILLFIFVAYKFTSFIRNKSIFLFTGITILSIISFLTPDFPIFKPFIQGYLGFAFLYVVMITGAFTKKSKIRIKLMQVRKEYSILGFIAITPHALNYLWQYIEGSIQLPIYGVVAYVIMIPLFITSFSFIRKMFKYKTWKNIQRFAYIVYVLIIIHLLVNSTTIEKINVILYVVLFIIYFVMKSIYVLSLYRKKI